MSARELRLTIKVPATPTPREHKGARAANPHKPSNSGLFLCSSLMGMAIENEHRSLAPVKKELPLRGKSSIAQPVSSLLRFGDGQSKYGDINNAAQ